MNTNKLMPVVRDFVTGYEDVSKRKHVLNWLKCVWRKRKRYLITC